MSKVPVCFVTGFLGSGKTTFIERLVDRFADKNIVYLVNEFSPKDVDGERLKLNEGELVKIPGGSIFCKCLTSQFIKVLNQVGEMAVDGVVIEASGIANPRVAGDMFRETKLDSIFDITSIVAVVDPRSFIKLCRTLPNIKEQIAASTHILVNKTDKYSDEKVNEVVEAVAELNDNVEIERTSFCATEMNIFEVSSPVGSGGEYAKCKDPNFCQVTIDISSHEKLEELKKKLAILGDDFFRAKGAICRQDKTVISVDYDGGDWIERVDNNTSVDEAGSIVVIASGYKEGALGIIKKNFE